MLAGDFNLEEKQAQVRLGPNFRVAGDTHRSKGHNKDLIVFPKEENFDCTLITDDPSIEAFRHASDAHFPMFCKFGFSSAPMPAPVTAPRDETAASPREEAKKLLLGSLNLAWDPC